MSKEVRGVSSTGGEKGVKQARFDLIPARALWLLAEHYGKGAIKYAPNQWRKGIAWNDLIAALERHMSLFKQGIDYDVCSNDPEGCLLEYQGQPWTGAEDTCWNHTGSHHMQAVMWMSFALMDHIEFHPEHDNRYIPSKPVTNQERFEQAFKAFGDSGVLEPQMAEYLDDKDGVRGE